MPSARSRRAPRSRPDRSSLANGDAIAASVEAAAALRVRAVEEAAAARPAPAMQLLRRALRTLPVDSDDLGAITVRTKTLLTMAYVQAETGPITEGLVHLGTARSLVGGMADGQHKLYLLGFAHHQHALILLRAGRIAESVELFDQAIPLLEEALGGPAGDPELLARAYMNRCLAHISGGRPGPAERDARACMALAAEHGFPLIGAKAEGNLGEIAQLRGAIPEALRYFEGAERAFRELAPGLVPRTKIDQARSLLAAGLADEAARHLDEALPELREHRIGQDLAEAEVARAAAALLAGDLTLAKQLATSARSHFVKRGSEPWAEVAALTRLRAEVEAALAGVDSTATPARAVALAERLAEAGLTDEAATATMLAVRLALRRRGVDAAEELLEQVPAPSRIAPIDHRMLLRLCRAEVALAHGQSRRVLAQAKAGLTELGAARDKMGGLDLVCGTAIHGFELGRLAVKLVLDNARTDADGRRLLDWQERTRAQIYRYEPQPAIDDPELATAVADLRAVMRTVQQYRLERRSTAHLERRITMLQREVSRLGWHTSHWGKPRPVCSAAEVIDRLGDRTLISFAGPGEDLAAVVVSGGRTRLFRLGRQEQVLEVARQLHADLDALAPDDLIEPLVNAVSRSALNRIELLDRWLFGPDGIPTELFADSELVIVPFGGLYSVPWESLPTLRGRAVSVAPSATAWVGAAEAPGTDGRVVLVCGPDLPESVSELDQLTAVYPDAVVLQGAEATTAAVLSAMDGAKLVHIAAHGTHEPANALFSRLELADGGLIAHEVARLHRPPEHIVLAACELALSHIRPGDEPLGFAGAMLASGSRTVVAAVNRVGHRSAALTMTDYHRRLASTSAAVDIAETMAEYHRRLASGTRPARALAEATAADPLRRPFILLGAG
ncbi:MAG TPA: CHAT domain-containing protein [Actinophytocola sp.]|jgi:tetratricopeptide (TPR) repeat protein|uniref:CHAT domain-containing protein n=1 Tax=Actinophytocola sp. TaxID=1872138 RepID=UPI002F945CC8